jgi:hypothetical protein
LVRKVRLYTSIVEKENPRLLNLERATNQHGAEITFSGKAKEVGLVHTRSRDSLIFQVATELLSRARWNTVFV